MCDWVDQLLLDVVAGAYMSDAILYQGLSTSKVSIFILRYSMRNSVCLSPCILCLSMGVSINCVCLGLDVSFMFDFWPYIVYGHGLHTLGVCCRPVTKHEIFTIYILNINSLFTLLYSLTL